MTNDGRWSSPASDDVAAETLPSAAISSAVTTTTTTSTTRGSLPWNQFGSPGGNSVWGRQATRMTGRANPIIVPAAPPPTTTTACTCTPRVFFPSSNVDSALETHHGSVAASSASPSSSLRAAGPAGAPAATAACGGPSAASTDVSNPLHGAIGSAVPSSSSSPFSSSRCRISETSPSSPSSSSSSGSSGGAAAGCMGDARSIASASGSSNSSSSSRYLTCGMVAAAATGEGQRGRGRGGGARGAVSTSSCTTKKRRGSKPGYFTHKVQPADTLLSIALQYDVPVPYLMLANKLSSSDIWFVDTVIIPCKYPRGNAVSHPSATPTTPSSSSSSSSSSSEAHSVGGGSYASVTGAPPLASSSPLRHSPLTSATNATAAAIRTSQTSPASSSLCHTAGGRQQIIPLQLPPSSRSSASVCCTSTNTGTTDKHSFLPGPPASGGRFSPNTLHASGGADHSQSVTTSVSVVHATGGEHRTTETCHTGRGGTLSSGTSSCPASTTTTTETATAAEYSSTQQVSAIPQSVHQSAHIAMLVDALVRQEGVDAKLARAQVTHWKGDFHAAALDCKEIRHWQQTLGVSVHEILAYLSVHDYDVDKARAAMVEDVRWHREQAARQLFRTGTSSRSWFSLNFFSQLFSPFSSSTRYARLPDHVAAVEAENGGEGSCSTTSSSHIYTEPPRIIGVPASTRMYAAKRNNGIISSAGHVSRTSAYPATTSALPASRSSSSVRFHNTSPTAFNNATKGSFHESVIDTSSAGHQHGEKEKEDSIYEEIRRRRRHRSQEGRARSGRPRPLDLEMTRL